MDRDGQAGQAARQAGFRIRARRCCASGVVYSKRPFGGPEAVLAYLARYTHRVAIANSRLIALEDGAVAFKWKDYRIIGRDRQKTISRLIRTRWDGTPYSTRQFDSLGGDGLGVGVEKRLACSHKFSGIFGFTQVPHLIGVPKSVRRLLVCLIRSPNPQEKAPRKSPTRGKISWAQCASRFSPIRFRLTGALWAQRLTGSPVPRPPKSKTLLIIIPFFPVGYASASSPHNANILLRCTKPIRF